MKRFKSFSAALGVQFWTRYWQKESKMSKRIKWCLICGETDLDVSTEICPECGSTYLKEQPLWTVAVFASRNFGQWAGNVNGYEAACQWAQLVKESIGIDLIVWGGEDGGLCEARTADDYDRVQRWPPSMVGGES